MSEPDRAEPAPAGGEWFRTTLYSIGDAVITTDAMGRVREMNPPAEALTGWTEAEARGLPVERIFRVIHETTREPVPSPVAAALAEDRVVELDNHALLIARDGSERPVADCGAPIRAADGVPAGAVLVFRDQTRERAAEDALRRSERRLLEAQRLGRIASWEIDLATRRHYWSEQMYEIFGGTVEGFGKSIWPFLERVHPDDRAMVESAFDRAVRERREYDVLHRIVLPNGEVRHVHSRGDTVYGADGRPLRTVGVLMDVSEMQEALDRAAYQTVLVDSVSDALISTDLDYRIRSWNRAAEQIYGWTAAEAVGRPLRELMEIQYATGSAEEARTELALRGVWRGEVRAVAKGGRASWIMAAMSMIRDARGRPTGIAAVNRDVTERRRLEMALAQAQRIESVGRLAGGVAHDFNNALQVILSHTEMALLQYPNQEPLGHELRGIESAANRSAALAAQLLAFARRQTAHPRIADLNDVIRAIRPMLGRLIGASIEITTDLSPDLWPIRIDPSQIDQILANLVVNARDAIAGVGRIGINTANVSLPGSSDRKPLAGGDYVRLTVTDTGSGIERDVLDRVFDPFFTTKPLGQGTGLGLAVVHGIVSQYGGAVEVESEVGAGTEFRIFLPRWQGVREPVAEAPPAAGPVGGTETIVLVEDEAQILSLMKRTLSRNGYRLIGFSSPVEALDRLAEWQEQADLVITDVVMPGYTGKDVLARVHQVRPDLKVLFVSGYPADVIAHDGILDEAIHLLQKPFTIQELTATVRRVLDDREPA